MHPADFSSEEAIKAGQEPQAASRNITGVLRQKAGTGGSSRAGAG